MKATSIALLFTSFFFVSTPLMAEYEVSINSTFDSGVCTSTIHLMIEGDSETFLIVITDDNGTNLFQEEVSGPNMITHMEDFVGEIEISITDDLDCTWSDNYVLDCECDELDYRITNASCDMNIGEILIIDPPLGMVTIAWTQFPQGQIQPQGLNPTGLIAGTYSCTYNITYPQANGTGMFECSPPVTLQFEVLDEICCENRFGEPKIGIALTSVVPECGSQMCKIDMRSLNGGKAPYTFLWNNGATSQNINNIPEGNYSVTVTDSEGCTNEQSIEVYSNFTPILTNYIIEKPCYNNSFGAEGYIRLNPFLLSSSTELQAFDYEWDDGSNSELRSFANIGTYVVTVIHAPSGCRAVAEIEVSDYRPYFGDLGIAAISTEKTCPENNTGTITIMVDGGSPPYELNWSDGIIQNGILHLEEATRYRLEAGTYQVTVTDHCGETSTEEITVEEHQLMAEASITAECGTPSQDEDLGSIDLTVTGDNQPYTYNWSNGSENQDLIDVPIGLYNVTISDAEGCHLYREYHIINQYFEIDVVNTPCDGQNDGEIELTIYNPSNNETTITIDGVHLAFENESEIIFPIKNLTGGQQLSIVINYGNGCIVSDNYTLESQPTLPRFGRLDLSLGDVDEGEPCIYDLVCDGTIIERDALTGPMDNFSRGPVGNCRCCANGFCGGEDTGVQVDFEIRKSSVATYLAWLDLMGLPIPIIAGGLGGEEGDLLEDPCNTVRYCTLNGNITQSRRTWNPCNEPPSFDPETGKVTIRCCFGPLIRRDVVVCPGDDLQQIVPVCKYLNIYGHELSELINSTEYGTSQEFQGSQIQAFHNDNFNRPNYNCSKIRFCLNSGEILGHNLNSNSINCKSFDPNTFGLDRVDEYILSGKPLTNEFASMELAVIQALGFYNLEAEELYYLISILYEKSNFLDLKSQNSCALLELPDELGGGTINFCGTDSDLILVQKSIDPKLLFLYFESFKGNIPVSKIKIYPPDCNEIERVSIIEKYSSIHKEYSFIYQSDDNRFFENIHSGSTGMMRFNSIRDNVVYKYENWDTDETFSLISNSPDSYKILIEDISQNMTIKYLDADNLKINQVKVQNEIITIAGEFNNQIRYDNFYHTVDDNSGFIIKVDMDGNLIADFNLIENIEPLVLYEIDSSTVLFTAKSKTNYIKINGENFNLENQNSYASFILTESFEKVSEMSSANNFSIKEIALDNNGSGPNSPLDIVYIVQSDSQFEYNNTLINDLDSKKIIYTRNHDLLWSKGITQSENSDINLEFGDNNLLYMSKTNSGNLYLNKYDETGLLSELPIPTSNIKSIDLPHFEFANDNIYLIGSLKANVNSSGLVEVNLYEETIKSSTNCERSIPILVTIPSCKIDSSCNDQLCLENVFFLDINTSDASCGNTDGSITIVPQGGMSPYTYDYGSGSVELPDDGIISNLEKGSYVITITDSDGCTATGEFVIEESISPTIQCRILELNSDPGPYKWLPVGQCDFSWVDKGTRLNDIRFYSWYVRAGLTYTWDTNYTGLLSGGNQNGGNNWWFQLNDLPVGTWTATVTVTDNVTGCQTVLDFEVVVEPDPCPLVVECVEVIDDCNESSIGSIAIDVTNGVEPYSYAWSNGSTTNPGTGFSAGTHSVTVTDSQGCTKRSICTVGGSIKCRILELNADPGPSAYLPVGQCTYSWIDKGTSLNDIRFYAWYYTPGLTYTWETNSSGPTTGGNNNGLNYWWFQLDDLEVGTWTASVTITDTNTGCVTVLDFEVVVEPDPCQLTVECAEVTDDCMEDGSGSISVAVTNGSEPYTYNWSNGATTNPITNLSPGTYTLTVTDNDGCTKRSICTVDGKIAQCRILEMNSDPGPYAWLPVGQCEFSWIDKGTRLNDIRFYAWYVRPGLTYTWDTNFSGATSGGNNNGGNNWWFQLNDLPVGTWTASVTITEDISGCQTVLDFEVVVEPDPCPLVVECQEVVDDCNEAGTGSILIDVMNGVQPYTYDWSNGSTTNPATGLLAGIHSVTVTDSDGCTKRSVCTVGGSPRCRMLELNDSSNPDVWKPVGQCEHSWIDKGTNKNDVRFYAWYYAPGLTYTWETNHPGLTEGGNNNGVNYWWLELNDMEVGTWTASVTVTDNDSGCVTVLDFEVTIEPGPCYEPIEVDLEYTNIDCDAKTYSIEALASGDAPHSHVWNNGTYEESLQNVGPGTYTVTVTDANNCEGTATTDIQDCNSPPLREIVVTPQSNCFYQFQIDLNAGSPGLEHIIWSFSNGSVYITGSGETELVVPFEDTGTYTLTLTYIDENGCCGSTMHTFEADCSTVRECKYSLCLDCVMTSGSYIHQVTVNGTNILNKSYCVGEPQYCGGPNQLQEFMEDLNKYMTTVGDPGIAVLTPVPYPPCRYHLLQIFNTNLIFENLITGAASGGINTCPFGDCPAESDITFNKEEVENKRLSHSNDLIVDSAYEFKLFPNPARNKVTIGVENLLNKSYDLVMMDYTGQEVLFVEKISIENFTIDLQEMPSGLYLIQIFIDNKQVVKKLIIE